MRILFVATVYLKEGKPATGFPNYLHRLSQALVSYGHVPMIIESGREDGHRVVDGVEVWTVKTSYAHGLKLFRNENWTHLKMSYFINRKIGELVKSQSIDIIQFTSIGGLALFYYGRTPAVMRLSSYAKTYFSTLQTYDAGTLAGKAALERLSARRCNAVFAPCRNTAEAFGRDCRRKVEVIETPFFYDVQCTDDQYVTQYLENKRYVLFFGTLYPEKGILVIAEILKKFLEENQDYSFVFVGEVRKVNGVDVRNILKKAAGDFFSRVFIWEALPHEKLYPIIKNADFVVLPSLMDNLPNACIEAMYFSKIVIGTDGASFEQLIISGHNGFLCKIGDSEDLLKTMNQVVSLEKTRKRQIEDNASKSVLRLRPEYTVKRLLHFYEYVIGERGEVNKERVNV